MSGVDHIPPKFQGTATKTDGHGLYVLTLSGRCSCGATDWGLAPDWKVPAERGGGYMTSTCPECLGTMEHSEKWERVDRVVSDYSDLKPDRDRTETSPGAEIDDRESTDSGGDDAG